MANISAKDQLLIQNLLSVILILLTVLLFTLMLKNRPLLEENQPTEPEPQAEETETTKPPRITDLSLAPQTVISSPLTVTGVAPQIWYFEGEFPVTLRDAQGNEIVTTWALAQGDWLLEEQVAFTTTLEFADRSPGRGSVVFWYENLATGEVVEEISVPVVFK